MPPEPLSTKYLAACAHASSGGRCSVAVLDDGRAIIATKRLWMGVSADGCSVVTGRREAKEDEGKGKGKGNEKGEKVGAAAEEEEEEEEKEKKTTTKKKKKKKKKTKKQKEKE